MKKYLVTGGSGFLGSAIVKRLVKNGDQVTVFDNQSRGSFSNLQKIKSSIRIINGDIRDKSQLQKAVHGNDSVIHLAYINGTEFFYKYPDVVLEVAVKGIMNVIDVAKEEGIESFYYASSSEVYNNPPVIPTPEKVPLLIPDPYNPRYSYSGGKILGELLTIHLGRKYFKRNIIFRPHNVYGPAMGKEHVIPQLILKMKNMSKKVSSFQIQGNGKQTRSFIYIDDFVEGFMYVVNKGKNLETYNIGTNNEIAIKKLCQIIAKEYGKKITIKAGNLQEGSPQRRCPDISKLNKLGFTPKITIAQGIHETALWYNANL